MSGPWPDPSQGKKRNGEQLLELTDPYTLSFIDSTSLADDPNIPMPSYKAHLPAPPVRIPDANINVRQGSSRY